MKRINYFLISLLIIIIDQLSKLYIRTTMVPGDLIRLTPKFFWIRYVENRGAGFSFSFGNPDLNRIIFSLITIIAVFVLIFLILKTISRTEALGFSLVLGGAMGNLIDRIWMGKVTDFVDWDFPDLIMERWPVFNVADSSIVCGVCLLAIFYLFWERKKTGIKVR